MKRSNKNNFSDKDFQGKNKKGKCKLEKGVLVQWLSVIYLLLLNVSVGEVWRCIQNPARQAKFPTLDVSQSFEHAYSSILIRANI